MTLGEKTGRDASSNHLRKWPESHTVSKSNTCAFSDLVDNACKGLMDKQIKYSIRRIQKMEEQLSGIEQELDAFLCEKNGK